MTIRFWDIRTGQEALSADFAGPNWSPLAFSPDGHRLVAGNAQGAVRILDGTPLHGSGDGGQVHTLEGHGHAVAWLAYSPDGGRIASASWDGTVKVWDARSGVLVRTLPAGDTPLTGVVFSPDGGRIAASSSDGTVRVWDAATGAELYPPLRARVGPVHGVAFSRNGRTLASAHHDGTIRLWEADSGRPRPEILAHPHPVLGLASSPGSEFLVSAGGKDRCAKVWEWGAESREPVLHLGERRGIFRNPTFSPDGGRVAAATGGRRTVWLLDATPGEKKTRESKEFPIPAAGAVHMAVFHPDGRRLFVVSDEHVQLLDPDTGAVAPVPAPHAGNVRCAALSPDGRFLATGAGYRDRGEVRIWEVGRWEKR